MTAVLPGFWRNLLGGAAAVLACAKHFAAGGSPDRLPQLSLYVALALALFAILFGTRTMDASEHHRGLMWAIAFESLVKLLAFLANGLRPENPSGLIISVRPENIEDKPEVLQLLADLGRGGPSERIELDPLDEGSTRRLMTAVMGKPARILSVL